MIKNIVLDMGNVLIRFDPELFLSRYALTEEQRKMLLEQVFRSVEWVMLDRGTLDEAGAEQRILPRLPETLHAVAQDLIEAWDEPLIPVRGMLELVRQLKQQGYQLYLLSNAAARQPLYWARTEAQPPDGWSIDFCTGGAFEARSSNLSNLFAEVCAVCRGMCIH